MDCSGFERRLADLSSGRLSAVERRTAEAHASGCAECSEMLALALLPVPAELEIAESVFVESVLARTSGAPCESTTLRLPELVDRSLEPRERTLVSSHVAGCARCRGLVAVLTALSRELPSLAQVRPDARFVDDVLRRTLPVHVQLRRWWGRVWPQWLRRPRFASEAAYVGLLVLVLIFATPGSPLEAVPQRALAVARQPVVSEVNLGEYLSERVGAVRAIAAESSGAETVGSWIAAGSDTAAKADEVVTDTAEGFATFWREAASLLGTGGEDAAQESPESTESNEEKP